MAKMKKRNLFLIIFRKGITDLIIKINSIINSLKKKKESACNAGDPGLIPVSGRTLGGGHGYPLQYSCLENPLDRGAWQAIDHRVAKSQT